MPINQRLARLIDLVPYISNHQGIPTAELAAKFGITVPELEKDLWILYCCGLPGQTPLELMEFNFEDGYVSVRNADELKTPRSLTKIELATLVIGLELLAIKGSETAEKLAGRLKEKLNSQISIKPDQGQIHLNDIEEAIQKNLVLQIRYRGKQREVIPFETYSDSGFFYLKAYCKTAKARRTFKINRIEQLKKLEVCELPPNDVASSEIKFDAKIKIHSNQRLVREILGGTQDISFFSKEWLTCEIMALGGNVEALTPEIRLLISEKARAGKNLYLG
jgi:proteasome accessory factor C